MFHARPETDRIRHRQGNLSHHGRSRNLRESISGSRGRLLSPGLGAGLLVLVCWGMTCGISAGAFAAHPMDPLSAEEYSAIVAIVRANDLADASSRFPWITLHEPPKRSVLAWTPDSLLPRRGFAVVQSGELTTEVIVDLDHDTLLSSKPIEGVQPGVLLSEEWQIAQLIVRANQDWRTAIEKRGIHDFEKVVCVPTTVGNFGGEETDRRLFKVLAYYAGDGKNYWSRPIEGVIAVFDPIERKVLRVIDTGVIPMPETTAEFDSSAVGSFRDPTHPITTAQPDGPTFEIRGHLVQWQKWQFHFRIDPRMGPIISLVRYHDKGSPRSILYQGSLSELFVPYMDPTRGWYFRTAMDEGEFGLGRLASELVPLRDCPANATFLDAVFADEWGVPYVKKRAACLFERDTGNIEWRHHGAESGETEVRKRTELVFRSSPTVGNYDYVIDWIFGRDGSIRIAVGASGVALVKGVASRTTTEETSARDERYGHRVADHTVAVNHDHFFSFRLDLDVDGPDNSFVADRLVTRQADAVTPRKSFWAVDSRTASTEAEAKLRIDLERPALWRVVNPGVTGPLGYPVSYQLRPMGNAVSLLSSDDPPQLRAGFTDHHLWVTPYSPDERFAAGMYPNQSRGGDGLPRWTSEDRPIEKTDIVLWYTLGFHHVVRAEDWPVMPTVWHEFELRPFDFFERNPALDLPE